MDKKIIDQFYFEKDSGKPDLHNYGKFRLGLTSEEVSNYLTVRAWQHSKKFSKKLEKKYQEIAGCNTCAVVDGIVLHYRHDVERFADALFDGKGTYFD
jgi:hypothetical protein